jgi:hypothetical protein
MRSFLFVESEYSRVADLLLSGVPGFQDSLEYERLNETERRLPGVVAAAFFVRFQDAELSERLVDRDATTLASAYRVIEQLAESSNGHIKDLLQDEIFENIRASEATWGGIESRLGPVSKTLLRDWRTKNP